MDDMPEEVVWLRDWFARLGCRLPDRPEEISALNYFEAKLIDSLKVIELITEIEDHFRIRFSETHFQERRFSTIGGLGALIGELRAGQE